MYSLSEAAKATGKSRSTIQRAIKKGTLGSSKDVHGQYVIEPSELHRVYPAVAFDIVAQQSNDQPRNSDEAPEMLSELIALRAEAKVKDQLLSAHESTIGDLRDRLDREGEERRQIMARLTVLTEQPTPQPRKGFFSRVFG